jgi:uncharacterized protein YecE (DUF72 family)
MEIIGTAGWSIPKEKDFFFPTLIDQSELQLSRYARVLNGVEINSSFYRDHRAQTYEKWTTLTPDDFQFSIKLHQRFTHECDLVPESKDLINCLEITKRLEKKWGALLMQFPPQCFFDLKKMDRFYKIIRKVYLGPIVIEPRNTTWKTREAAYLMKDYGVTKVIADPEKCPSRKLSYGPINYYRLHGFPLIYKSSYSKKFLKNLATDLTKERKDVWVIFDNTGMGKGAGNALDLIDYLRN